MGRVEVSVDTIREYSLLAMTPKLWTLSMDTIHEHSKHKLNRHEVHRYFEHSSGSSTTRT